THSNGAGLCEACNHTKETPGWSSRPRPGPRHTLEVTTPTGHSHHSTAPPLPGTDPVTTGPAASRHQRRERARVLARARHHRRPAA
ncbi:MAG TPA: HNH endonuclease, partial [Arthrobacter sp.]|nr:HNH endonuclease [Arthrobacter sp.]